MIINAYRWRYIGRFMGEQLRLLPLHHSACRSTTARLLLPIWTWSWALKSVPPKYITNHWNGKMVENDVINNFKKSKLGLGFFLNSYRQTDIPDILGDVLWDQNLCEGHSEYLERQVSAILQRNYATVYISGATFWNCKVAYFNLFHPLCTLFFCHCTDFYAIFSYCLRKKWTFLSLFSLKWHWHLPLSKSCHVLNHFGLPGIWVWIKSLAL